MAALRALLSTHGLLPAAAAPLSIPDAGSPTVLAADDFVVRFEPPDPPPPRA